MKKVVLSTSAAAVLILGLSLVAVAKPKSSTWTGWLSDSGCGAKGIYCSAVKKSHPKGRSKLEL